MKIVLSKVKKGNLLLAGLLGISISILVWMLTLPSGFISKTGLVLAAGILLSVIFVCYKFLLPYFINHYHRYTFRPWIIILVLVLLSGIAYQKVTAQTRFTFPFVPKQTFSLTLNSDQLSFRPVECDLVTLYSKAFRVSGGNLERIDSTLMILSGKGAVLSWTGWVGESCELTIADPDNEVNADVAWNGQHTPLNNLPQVEEYPLSFSFEPSLLSRLAIFLVVLLACASGLFFLTCAFMALTTPGNPGEKPHLAFRNAKRESAVLCGTFILFDLTLLLRLFAPLNPANYLPDRDQSIYLYIGKALLSGLTPYKDVWDHKGPVIYFINALANLIDPAGQWGVFVLLLLFLAGTVLAGYFLLRRRMGNNSLFVSLSVFLGLLLAMKTFDNLVEVYALLFLALGLLAVVKVIENEDTRKMLYFGIACGLVFCLRPNLVSLFIVGGLAWFITAIIQKQKTGKGILLFGLGFFIVLLPIAVFFLARGAMADLVDQVFTYNFRYIDNNGIGLWDKLTIYSPETLPVALIGLLGIQYTVGVGRQNKTDKSNTTLLILLTVTFFLEMVFSRISGFDFYHYSLPLMLFAVIVFSFFVESIREVVQQYRSGVVKTILFGCSVIGLMAGSIWNSYTLVKAGKSSILPEYLQAANVYQFHARPTLLVWGAEVQVNYVNGIPSPTRYIYQYPLMNDAYCTQEMGLEFANDIKTNLPVILDASHGNSWISPLDAEKRKQAEAKPHNYGTLACLDDFFDFFYENYSPAYSMVGRHWTIYLPKNVDSQ